MRDLETMEERVHAALDQTMTMGNSNQLSEDKQESVFQDVRNLLFEEERKAKETLSCLSDLLEQTRQVQKRLSLSPKEREGGADDRQRIEDVSR
ncbi:hypothetical protein [Brevinema andersonii]|uniref:hypothetical protein n=1 Tax=Brevinema andersonii TaxID=34097 RepID=UPI001178311A|nr:hypothetical protein [Brevinema andersonii]